MAQTRVAPADLLAELQQVGDEIGGLPSAEDVEQHSRHPLAAFVDEFGSFPEALAAAGFDLPDFEFMPSDAELLSDLHRIFAIVHKRPTHADVDEHGQWYPKLYKDRWGNFTNALEAGGFRTEGSPIPDAELVADVRRARESVDGPLTRKKYDEVGRVTAKSVDNRIGWRKTVEQLDEQPSTSYTDSEILEDVARVWRQLGHEPTASEMAEHGTVSPTTADYRLGSWAEGKRIVQEKCSVSKNDV